MILKDMKITARKNRKAGVVRRQKGIALLFTLSILSVALVTVLIFSSNAITTQKVAATFADNTAARFLADGTVDRALAALMNSEKFNFVCSNYQATKSYINGSNPNRGACDFIWHLEKQDLFTFNKGPIRYAAKYYDYDDPRCPSWEYIVFKDNNASSMTDKIFGRYAYVAISHNDQLNANAIGNRHGESNDDVFQRRLGRWTCEPQFILKKTVDKSLWDETSRVSSEKIRDAFKQRNFAETNDGWSELDVFFNDVTGHAASGSRDRTLKLMLEQYFGLDTAGDYNKFAVGGNLLDLTQVPGAGQAYRYALIRPDWNTVSVGDVLAGIPWLGNGSADAGIRNQTAANLINYCAPATRDPVTDADWVTGEPTYTGNKRTPYINEVAGRAHLSGQLGNKIVVSKMVSDDPPEWLYDVHYENCSYDANLSFQVELVNMYPSTGDNAALAVNPPILYGTFKFDYFNAATDTWGTKSVDFSANADLTVGSSEKSSGSYPCYVYTVSEPISIGGISTHTEYDLTTEFPDEGMFEADIRVRNARLTLNRVILKTTDGVNADLALMPTQMSDGEGFVIPVSEDETVVYGVSAAVDMQTNDPRCNLGRGMWTFNNVNESNWDENLGSQNTAVNIGSNTDPENTKDPGYVSDSNHISTAFIRHNSMQSLWELGAIHRGEPWRTINLKRARPEATGMGNYEDGDGHILDHVALQTTDLINQPDPGYINLNTSSDFGGTAAPFVFKALFNGFPQTSNGDYATLDKYPGPASNIRIIKGDSIDSTESDADKCAEQIQKAVDRVLNNQYSGPVRRTAIMPYDDESADLFNLVIPTTGTDAQREEIFPRIVNLLKWTRQKTTSATILVIAQTIQDVGGAKLTYEYPDANATGQSFDDYVRMHFGHKNFAGQNIIDDAYPASNSTLDVKFGKYDIGFDHILGESKLIVRLKWDNKADNNKGAWKVVRKEYVN